MLPLRPIRRNHTLGRRHFPIAFEICWYCQAGIIRSGSKWSTYYCGECRGRFR